MTRSATGRARSSRRLPDGPVLVFDTSGATLAVGIWRAGETVWERVDTFASGRLGHAALLVPRIEEALAATGLELSDLAGAGFTIGPGSYTGLRVGLATAKGLALAGRVPLAAVGTLAAIALPHASRGRLALAAIDARRSRVYAAAYTLDERGELREVMAPARLPAEEALRRAKEAYSADPAAEVVRAEGPPSSAAIGRLAAARLARGGDDPMSLAPCYVGEVHTGPVPGAANASDGAEDVSG